jgi:hypothetical protein
MDIKMSQEQVYLVNMVATILVVEKNGAIKEVSYKSAGVDDLYKKAGLKVATGFACFADWEVVMSKNRRFHISVYGKTTGRANHENKYEFPPPIDNTLFFGNCVIVNMVDGAVGELSASEWEDIYQQLYGGFEDIGEEEEAEDDEESASNVPLTKTGYVKDDFVVDDEDEEESESEGSVEIVPLRKTPPAKPKKNKAADKPMVNNWVKSAEVGYDCMSELSEEDYV